MHIVDLERRIQRYNIIYIIKTLYGAPPLFFKWPVVVFVRNVVDFKVTSLASTSATIRYFDSFYKSFLSVPPQYKINSQTKKFPEKKDKISKDPSFYNKESTNSKFKHLHTIEQNIILYGISETRNSGMQPKDTT